MYLATAINQQAVSGHRFWECLWAVLVMSNDPIITAGLKTEDSREY